MLENIFCDPKYIKKFQKIPGNIMILVYLKKFDIFSNLTFFNKYKTQYARSAGTYCIVNYSNFDYKYLIISLPTGSKRYIFLGECYVILGRNSNKQYRFKKIIKSSWLMNHKKKPKVRGVARNPVDHPHGGMTKTNSPEVSLWGWIAKKNR